MPYAIEKDGDEYLVRNKDTGKVKGRHKTRVQAQRQMNLLRGIEHGWEPTGAPAKK